MGCTHSTRRRSSSVEPLARLKKAAYLELNSDKTLTGELRTFGAKGSYKKINFDALQGKYAYCIIEHKHANQPPSQYLLINPMQDEQSNHGCFELFKKKVPGYNPESSRIIVGGEITFEQEITWNVKSQGYSMHQDSNGNYADFDFRNPNFNTTLTTLWIPGRHEHCNDSDMPKESPAPQTTPRFFSAQAATPTTCSRATACSTPSFLF